MHVAVFRWLFSISLLVPTTGCQTISDVFADLFGETPPDIAATPVPVATPVADRVVVNKGKRTLALLRDGTAFETFPIALGREPRGPKQKEGDGRTPEGVYTIDWRSDQTRYTRELHISYPEMRDRERANDMNVEPGSAIFIHGLPRDYGPFDPPQWYRDWTEGCISVGNVAIVKIWDAVPDGTPIEIIP
jgi:murein L,D-transpeptidase YafK